MVIKTGAKHKFSMQECFTHLYVEVFKRHSVPAEQLHGVPGHEADPKETLHLVWARPIRHLGAETGRERRVRLFGNRKSGVMLLQFILHVTDLV